MQMSMSFPKPRGATLGVMLAMGFIWLTSALAINWGGASGEFLQPFICTTDGLQKLQLWRLVTANFIHLPQGDGAISHILTSLVCIYFFAPALEDRWGWKKMLGFFLATGTFGYVCQAIVGAIVPQLRQPVFFGGLPIADATVIAWALQADSRSKVLLFFVLPVSPMMIIAFTVGMNVLKLIAIGAHLEGLVTPFGGMAMGWALSDRSSLRRAWLRFRLKRIQAETEHMRKKQSVKARAASAGFRVIHGEADPPKDKRWLN